MTQLDIQSLIQEIELQKSLMIAVSTGGYMTVALGQRLDFHLMGLMIMDRLQGMQTSQAMNMPCYTKMASW